MKIPPRWNRDQMQPTLLEDECVFDMCPLSFSPWKSLVSKTFAWHLIFIMKTMAATLKSFNAALRLFPATNFWQSSVLCASQWIFKQMRSFCSNKSYIILFSLCLYRPLSTRLSQLENICATWRLMAVVASSSTSLHCAMCMPTYHPVTLLENSIVEKNAHDSLLFTRLEVSEFRQVII